MQKIYRQEASSLLGVHADTLRRWEEEGKIIGERTFGGQTFHNKPSHECFTPVKLY